MAGLYAPLPTLRSHPRGGLRTDRGRRGLLLLHRSGLSPHTPCRSPGALTHVAACTLPRSPIRDPLPEGFRHFVASMPAPVASGWSESPGGPCTHWKAPPCHGARGKRSFRNRRNMDLSDVQPRQFAVSSAPHKWLIGPPEDRTHCRIAIISDHPPLDLSRLKRGHPHRNFAV